MDHWIAASLFLSDGRVIRFGPDEADAENVPSDIAFDTSNPGGFGSASITLPRPEDLRADDAKLFSHVELYGPGNTVFYEGFINGIPQVGADSIQLNLSGWISALDKHETFREIFVDRDLGRWGASSLGRQADYLGIFGKRPTEGSAASDTTTPTLLFQGEPAEVNPIRVSTYNAGAGCQIGSIYYAMTSESTSSYVGQIIVMDDADGTTTEATADLLTGTNSSASGTFTPTAKYRYGEIIFYLAGTVGATETSMSVASLAVFGNHGLTKRGTAPNQGFYASDIISYAISQATSLNYSTDSIETTSFVIPHLTFTDDTNLRSVIEQVTALGGNQNVANDWGVYEDRTFYWRSPGTYGRTWHVRRDQVATSSSDGPDADRRVAGIKINYTDGAGTSLSVGPPGSNSDYETTSLLDSDTDNPAYRIPGAYKSESVGITSQAGAINIGTMILNERNRLDWRGSVTITGEAEDEKGNLFPAALIRAGDRIVVSDSGDTTERTIVSTSYDHSSLTTTASIGATPDSLEALLGQLAAVTDLIGT
jgi:hypothetical protein